MFFLVISKKSQQKKLHLAQDSVGKLWVFTEDLRKTTGLHV